MLRLKLILLMIGSLFISCKEEQSENPTQQVDNDFVPTLTGNVDKLPLTKLFSGNTNPANAGSQYTPTFTTTSGVSYTAWMDNENKLRLAEYKNGTKKEVTLRENIQENKFHIRPSVVVDELGFIHVTADMHNQEWVYYRSLLPNDIDNFEKIKPDGKLITYANFYTDQNGQVYVTFRHKVKSSAFTQGSSGGGVLRYDASTKAFKMLGGTSHGFDKTLVWVNMGGAGTHYQQPGIRLHFDNTGRVHLVCTLIAEPTDKSNDGNTHVLYAYSDNRGDSWFTVEGKAISNLPMTPELMSVVAVRSENDILANAFIGAYKKDRPVVGWKDGDGNHIVRWNGEKWVNILPAEITTTCEFYTRRENEISIYRPGFGFYVSNDGGASYESKQISPYVRLDDAIFDRGYYILTGNHRILYSNQSDTEITYASYEY